MSRQRNTPNDPAAELAEYDLDASEGTSPEDRGSVSAATWPEHLDKSEVTPEGQEIITKWINSTYSELTEMNIREFRNEHGLSKDTTRNWLYRAFPDQRDLSDLRKVEKKAVVAVAAYGDDYSYSDYREMFGFSNSQINMAKNGVPDIVEKLREKHSQEKLESEAEQLKQSNDDTLDNQFPRREGVSKDKKKELRAYFKQHPNAGVNEAMDAVNVDADPSVVGSIKGGVNSTRKDSAPETVPGETTAETFSDGQITITINLSRESARGVVMNQELDEQVTNRVVESILNEVGL